MKISSLKDKLSNYFEYKDTGCDEQLEIYHIAIDSRSVIDPEHTIFYAIRSEVNDGNRYIPELYNRGVRAFITDTDYPLENAIFFIHKSIGTTPITFQRPTDHLLSSLEALNGNILITGSVGKTETKELLFRTLRKHSTIFRTPGSWNSQLGVPLGYWSLALKDVLNSDTGIIYEVGIDRPHPTFNCLLPPHIAIITPITDEHDENFATHEEKILTKIKLCKEAQHIIFDTSDNAVEPLLRQNTRAKLHPVKFEQSIETPTVYHALVNEALRILNIDIPSKPEPIRSNIRYIQYGYNGCQIIIDKYTEDLQGLYLSLEYMQQRITPNQTPRLILGELLEFDASNKHESAQIYLQAFALAKKIGIKQQDIAVISNNISSDDFIFASANIDVKFYSTTAEYIAQNPMPQMASTITLLHSSTPSDLHSYFEAPTHDSSLTVNLKALTDNYNYFRHKLPPQTGMIGMIKAQAYGVGAIEVGKTLQNLGAAYLAVAVIDEGLALRNAGISMPVMVLNPITNRFQSLFANRLEPVVFSLEELDKLISEASTFNTKNYPIHIKLDTGMHRVGFISEQIPELISRLRTQTFVRVASVFSHLATADCLDMDSYTQSQLDTFDTLANTIKSGLGYDFKRHILNTAGILRFADHCKYDLARLGIGLYGIAPYEDSTPINIKPVATFRARIISLKDWDKGTPIGYGCRTILDKPTKVATIPVGYADGINRHLGRGHAAFVVNGVYCKTLGNICMDQCIIDVTDVPDVTVGDSVEIFGTTAPIERLAQTLDTIPYEILTSISPRVPRIYVFQNEENTTTLTDDRRES